MPLIQFNPGHLNNTTMSEVNTSQSSTHFSWLFRTYERYILKSVLHWSLWHVKLINPASSYAYFCLRRDDKTTSLLLTEVQVRRTASSTLLKWNYSFTPVKLIFLLHLLLFVFFFSGNSAVLSSFRKELFQDWLVNRGQRRWLSEEFTVTWQGRKIRYHYYYYYYSRTFLKRPPKMSNLGDRFWEMVACGS